MTNQTLDAFVLNDVETNERSRPAEGAVLQFCVLVAGSVRGGERP